MQNEITKETGTMENPVKKINRKARVDTSKFSGKIIIPELQKYFTEADLLNHVAFIMNHMDPYEMSPFIRRIITGRYIEQRTWSSIRERMSLLDHSFGYFYYWAKKAEDMLHKEMNRILLTCPIQALILKQKRIPDSLDLLYNALNNGECRTIDVLNAHMSYMNGDNGTAYAKLFRRKIHQEIAFTQKSCDEYEELMDVVIKDLNNWPDSYIYTATTIASGGYAAEDLRAVLEKNKIVHRFEAI